MTRKKGARTRVARHVGAVLTAGLVLALVAAGSPLTPIVLEDPREADAPGAPPPWAPGTGAAPGGPGGTPLPAPAPGGTRFRFGMDAASLEEQALAGAPADYAQTWVGVWNLAHGWKGTDADLRRARDAGAVPVVMVYYWGDDLSPTCVATGCMSTAHAAWKDRAGWDLLLDLLGRHLEAELQGAPAIVVLEPEFNKGGLAASEDWDAMLAQQAERLRAAYPEGRVALGFGNWGRGDWGTFDRAAAATDLLGLQAMRGATRDAQPRYASVAQDALAGARELQARFGKPVLLSDVALSSHPEPAFVDEQTRALEALLAEVPALREAGVEGLVYRAYADAPRASTDEYFGEAERHWGLAWAMEGPAKPALAAWVDAVRAERARARAADLPR